ncbi:MAG: MFS transporter [Rhodobacteraceae bacterium]|nr:MFS transporter [Paracoccaceae bacterium]
MTFALVYALFGFVAARLSVPGRRKPLLVAAMAVWSLATIAQGAAIGFASMLVGRLVVGIGEAAVVPASHAMIADAYPAQRRASAMALFQSGANIGLLLAFVIGGAVAATWGWRAAFIVAGAPGLVLAVILLVWLPEPGDTAAPDERATRPGLRLAFGLVWGQTSARCALLGSVLSSLVSFGGVAWVPTYLAREHTMTLQQVGLYLAVLVGVIGALGTWLGGALSDRAEARSPGGRMRVVVASVVIAKLGAVVFYLLGPSPLALIVFVIPVAVNGVFVAPAMSHVYGHLPARQRPMASAILMFGANFVGLGLGPITVGVMSDLFQGLVEQPLGLALGILQVFGFWAAWMFWRAGKTQTP